MTALEQLMDAGVVQRDIDIAPLTTYKLGGPAKYFAEPEDRRQLEALAEAVSEADLPVLPLGRGSNLVVSDEGYPGLVLRLGEGFRSARLDESGAVVSGAARSLPSLARFAVDNDRGGLEFLVGIPGSVGGAIRMNAGCHGSEVVDWLMNVEVLDFARGEMTVRNPHELGLTYRRSALTDSEIVSSATFRTVSSERREGQTKMREISLWRKENQPGGTHNAGSVFMNPPGDAAGRIIDELGLKGFRVGRASVSKRHANFFEAEPGATAQEVYDLVHAVQSKVEAETGIALTPEIRFVGTFRPSAGRP